MLACLKGHGAHKGALQGAIDGGRIWWVAPDHTQIDKSEIWELLKRCVQHAGVYVREDERRIVFPSGGSVQVNSAEADLLGAGLDGLVIDEAARIKKETWTHVLRPMLADRQGWAMMITTPNGQNWLYDLFREWSSKLGAYATWQLPSSQNPLMTEAELETAKQDMGLWAFAQEHEAQFLSLAGAEFPGDYFPESMWFDDWPAADQIIWRVMALDPSKGKTNKSDYSAFVLLVLDHDGTLWVDADIERRPIRRIIDDGLALAAQFQPHAFGVEVNGFQETLADIYVERSKATGMLLPIHLISNLSNKRVRIRAGLTPYLSRHEIRFRKGSRGAKLLVDQLRAFPLDKHDDGPDALEIGINVLRHVFEHGVAA